jgi:hypothetical protein
MHWKCECLVECSSCFAPSGFCCLINSLTEALKSYSLALLVSCCGLLQVRERDSKSQQLLLTDMFKGAAAKAAEQQVEDDLEAAAAADGSDADSDNPCAAPRPAKDLEDLFGGSKGPDTAKAAAAAGRRGRVRVILDEDDAEGQAAGDGGDGMQLDQQPEQQQQAEGLRDKQGHAKQQQQQQEPEPMPDRVKDYRGWLAWQKQRWRAGRQERKRRKVEQAKWRPQAEAEELPQVFFLGGGPGHIGTTAPVT